MTQAQKTALPLLIALAVASAPTANAAETVLLEKPVHLGTPGFPEWDHFADSQPHGRQLDLRFQAARNKTEATLFIRQSDVKYPWVVKLNGKAIGNLENMEVELISHFSVKPGLLNDGENLLSIVPPKSTDDILVGEIVLDSRSFETTAGRCSLAVTVTERRGGEKVPVPCRITVTDERGALVPIHTDPDITLPTGRGVIETKPGQKLAVRAGAVYAPDGQASLGLRPGIYTVYASRGFEYTAATNQVVLRNSAERFLRMEIAREVSTEGWVAADCHIHNLTYSGHGDATIDEGMITIAGEGIEFAVATDHNHHTDYTETARKLAVSRHFTPVVGNEVTTKTGHFNAFPIAPGSSLPDHKLTDWSALLKSIRETTQAKVIVLNHPRNVHSGFSPVDPENFRQVTGEDLRGGGFTFEAMEIVTSASLQSDPMDPIRDWFGLLNHGYRITGVGSSDTHYVSRMILGQGRSYVKADDSDPANLDVAEIVRGYQEGRVAVSMGLLPEIRFEPSRKSNAPRFGMGDLATGLADDARVVAKVLGPRWVQSTPEDPTELVFYMNGRGLGRLATGSGIPQVVKIDATLDLPPGTRPRHDFWIVAVATAPGVTAPFWAIPRPYQPSSKKWTPRVIGVTNPIYVDGDGDGKYTPPRGYAERLVRKHGNDLPALFLTLKDYDRAVAAQTASLLLERGFDFKSDRFRSLLRDAFPTTKEAFAAFEDSLR